MFDAEEQQQRRLTPNEEYCMYNTSPEAYKRLGDGIVALRLVHHGHARVRGRYDEYPERMLCVDPRKELFVRCNNCNRAHCTDPWLPGIGSEPGYVALYDRVRLQVVPDPRRPWLTKTIYYCAVDIERCAKMTRK